MLVIYGVQSVEFQFMGGTAVACERGQNRSFLHVTAVLAALGLEMLEWYIMVVNGEAHGNDMETDIMHRLSSIFNGNMIIPKMQQAFVVYGLGRV